MVYTSIWKQALGDSSKGISIPRTQQGLNNVLRTGQTQFFKKSSSSFSCP